MLINRWNPLAFYTHVIDANGKDVPFSEIDTEKRTGKQHVLTGNKETGSLLWTIEKPFPYDIIIHDPDTNERIKNPCEHDLKVLELKAKSMNERFRAENRFIDTMAKAYRIQDQMKEYNKDTLEENR